MKNGALLLVTLTLFCIHASGMELSPRSSHLFQEETPELKQMQSLLQIIESEASYANPYAVARIQAASKELFAFNQPLQLFDTWRNSKARSIATLHYERSCHVVITHKNTNLEGCAKLLHQQASQIFLAITELNEKIEKSITLEQF